MVLDIDQVNTDTELRIQLYRKNNKRHSKVFIGNQEIKNARVFTTSRTPHHSLEIIEPDNELRTLICDLVARDNHIVFECGGVTVRYPIHDFINAFHMQLECMGSKEDEFWSRIKGV